MLWAKRAACESFLATCFKFPKQFSTSCHPFFKAVFLVNLLWYLNFRYQSTGTATWKGVGPTPETSLLRPDLLQRRQSDGLRGPALQPSRGHAAECPAAGDLGRNQKRTVETWNILELFSLVLCQFLRSFFWNVLCGWFWWLLFDIFLFSGCLVKCPCPLLLVHLYICIFPGCSDQFKECWGFGGQIVGAGGKECRFEIRSLLVGRVCQKCTGKQSHFITWGQR